MALDIEMNQRWGKLGPESDEVREAEGLFPYDSPAIGALARLLRERLVLGREKKNETLQERLHRPDRDIELSEPEAA
jgi:hypothetical protein